jgi:hypothetical protein
MLKYCWKCGCFVSISRNGKISLQKLVNEVFQTMWFTALSNREKDSSKLLQRVVNITEVVHEMMMI